MITIIDLTTIRKSILCATMLVYLHVINIEYY